MISAVAPLVRGSTYRRGIYLLLGGVILLPYALLAVVFVQTLTTPAGARGVTVLLAATVAIAGVPAFLQEPGSGDRGGPRAAWRRPARSGAERRGTAGWPGDRVRSALWFALHLVTGGLVALGLLGPSPAGRIAALEPRQGSWLSATGWHASCTTRSAMR